MVNVRYLSSQRTGGSVLARVWLLPVLAFPLLLLLLFQTVIMLHEPLSLGVALLSCHPIGKHKSFLTLQYEMAIYLLSSLRAKRTKQNPNE